MSDKSKKGLLLAVVAIGFISIFFFEPYHQRLEYHNFADRRALLFGIRNTCDVLSNIPFSIFGFVGLLFVWKYPNTAARLSWFVGFLGVFLVGIGSAYYHYTPNNQTLIWDRLPLTIGFMGVLSAILTQCISKDLEKLFLSIFVSLGAFSVIYWANYDDLRFYFYVQAIPLVIIPFAVTLFDSSSIKKLPLIISLALYLLAKATEFSDLRIFEFTGLFISGHTIKHLLASLVPLVLALMVREQSLSSERRQFA